MFALCTHSTLLHVCKVRRTFPNKSQSIFDLERAERLANLFSSINGVPSLLNLPLWGLGAVEVCDDEGRIRSGECLRYMAS